MQAKPAIQINQRLSGSSFCSIHKQGWPCCFQKIICKRSHSHQPIHGATLKKSSLAVRAFRLGAVVQAKPLLAQCRQRAGKLRRRNLVSSVRGPGGGYRLAQPMQGITVAAIVIAVDEPLDATQCGGKENCADDKRCMTHDLWANLNKKMHEYLSSVSLGDLVAQQVNKPVAVLVDKRTAEKVAA